MTEKWRDVWFGSLSPEGKLLFLYLIDNCDIAGFWEINWRVASFDTGLPTEDEGQRRGLAGAFQEIEKAYLIDDTKGWIWLRNFLYHQGNLPLNINNPCHKGILSRIAIHNSFGEQVLREIEKTIHGRGLLAPTKGLQSPYSNSNSNISNINIGEESKGGGRKKRTPKPIQVPPDFKAFWDKYPRKTAKPDALKAWGQTEAVRPPLDKLLAALDQRIAFWKREKKEVKYVTFPATWLRQHRWADQIEDALLTESEDEYNARLTAMAEEQKARGLPW